MGWDGDQGLVPRLVGKVASSQNRTNLGSPGSGSTCLHVVLDMLHRMGHCQSGLSGFRVLE